MRDQNLLSFLRYFLSFLEGPFLSGRPSFVIFRKNLRSLVKSTDPFQQLLVNNLSFPDFSMSDDMTSLHRVNYISLLCSHKNSFHPLQNTVFVKIKHNTQEFTI